MKAMLIASRMIKNIFSREHGQKMEMEITALVEDTDETRIETYTSSLELGTAICTYDPSWAKDDPRRIEYNVCQRMERSIDYRIKKTASKAQKRLLEIIKWRIDEKLKDYRRGKPIDATVAEFLDDYLYGRTIGIVNTTIQQLEEKHREGLAKADEEGNLYLVNNCKIFLAGCAKVQSDEIYDNWKRDETGRIPPHMVFKFDIAQ